MSNDRIDRRIEYSVSQLSNWWDTMNWEKAEKKLANLQRELTIAAQKRAVKQMEHLQNKIVSDIDIQCMAVRHVTSMGSSPGVDGVRWKTSAEKMQAALDTDAKHYHASPIRQVLIIAKNSGKERRTGILTYRDRMMQVLYGYAFLPVCEAYADRQSFAFRPGRSQQDAHAYLLDALNAPDAPEFIVCADIKAYYANIQHDWLIENVPLDKHILSEFLGSGIIFAGELFPSDGTGISEGSNISPYIGNFVLDGLQNYLYKGLTGTTHPKDHQNGNLIRYADDIFIMVRTKEDAEQLIALLKEFLAVRGLVLSAEKTRLATVKEGFTFLSVTYKQAGKYITSYPSEKAIERFIADVTDTIRVNKKAQRDLIKLLNQKLNGWAGYYRYTDAEDAFRRVDVAVQTALLEAALAKYVKSPKQKIIDKFWYREPNGERYYSLPEDRTIRVMHLTDVLRLNHQKVNTKLNPFLETDYWQQRDQTRQINNVTGPYHSVWERQKGLCHYCGRPILPDQAHTIVPLNISRRPSVKNSAYVHTICTQNEFELVTTMEDITNMRHYDVLAALEDIEKTKNKNQAKKIKNVITTKWKHYKLKQYFAEATAASITLTFRDIEKIDGRAIPHTGLSDVNWWYPRNNCNTIAEAWLTEGYKMEKLDIQKQKITLKRTVSDVANLVIPAALIDRKIPDNAKYELENYMAYIIKKYGL